MEKVSKYVGLDVHKKTIAVSVAQAGGGEARYVVGPAKFRKAK